MRRLEYFTSFWEFSNDRAIELASRLVELAPDGLTHVYFTSGGSESNEAALRMARYVHSRRGHEGRDWILARRSAYHGIGYGSGSASGLPIYHEGFGPMLPHVRHLTPPWPYRTELFDGRDPTDFCLDELERTISELGGDRIAAMIGEPIMGVGGMLVPPDDYWPRVRELLSAHGILLIFDEVVTAFGRTGSWFGAQHFGVEPDLIVTAKGITSGYVPLGAVLVSEPVAEELARDHGFPVGFTYNGHPTACAVALRNLEIIEREGLLDQARRVGAFLLDELSGLEELPVVGEVRGVGMMLGIELVVRQADPHADFDALGSARRHPARDRRSRARLRPHARAVPAARHDRGRGRRGGGRRALRARAIVRPTGASRPDDRAQRSSPPATARPSRSPPASGCRSSTATAARSWTGGRSPTRATATTSTRRWSTPARRCAASCPASATPSTAPAAARWSPWCRTPAPASTTRSSPRATPSATGCSAARPITPAAPRTSPPRSPSTAARCPAPRRRSTCSWPSRGRQTASSHLNRRPPQAGDSVTFEAEIDVLVVLSACPMDLNPINATMGDIGCGLFRAPAT